MSSLKNYINSSLLKWGLGLLFCIVNISQAATITRSTPGQTSYTVPPGVYNLYVTVNGGGGGGGGGDVGFGGNGGAGQQASGYLAVTPGQVLQLIVGGGGAGGATGGSGTGGGAGGSSPFGGGGVGGNPGSYGASGGGGGGGGASAIQLSGGITLIAAGGGGGGVGGVNGVQYVNVGNGLQGGDQNSNSGTTSGGAGTNRGVLDGGGGGGGGGGYNGGGGGAASLDGSVPTGNVASGGTGYLSSSINNGVLVTGGGGAGGAGMNGTITSTYGGTGTDGSVTIVEQTAISGQVQLDTLGTGTTGSGISGVTVRLYDVNGNNLASTTTNAAGNYVFTTPISSTLTQLPNGTYYVSVASPNNGAGVVAEQTYASIGTGNSGTAAGTSGYGPICVGPSPAYTQQSSTTPSSWIAQSTSGSCFGGRQGAVADSNVSTLTSNEHVTRVILNTSTSIVISSVNFAFSYNVVTNVNDIGQGTFRQFMLNANSQNSANSMRFVPAMAANTSTWWTTIIASTLPTLTVAGVTIDGTAYSNQDGVTKLSQVTIGTGGNVGANGNSTSLSLIASPLLAIQSGLTSNILIVGSGANNTKVQNLSIYSTVNSGNGIDASASTLTGLLIHGNVLGYKPDGSTPSGKLYSGVAINNFTNGSYTISNNYVGNTVYWGFNLQTNVQGTLGNYLVSNNEVVQTGEDGIALSYSSYTKVTGNLVRSTRHVGIELWLNSGNNQVSQNTVTTTGTSNVVNESGAVRISGGGNNTITLNQFVSNGGPFGGGVMVASNTSGNLISQNQFSNNSGVSIDNTASATGSGDGVTTSTACVVNSTQLGRPVINTAILSGSSLSLSGTMCGSGTYTIEVYQAAGAGTAGSTNNDMGSDGRLAGEGILYLGSLQGKSNGTFSGTITNSTISGLTSNSKISATAIRTVTDGVGVIGDTSEFAANAGFNTASGMVFEDVVGNQGVQVPRAGVTVCGFTDNGDGIPNSDDTLDQCVTTDVNGTYTLSTDMSNTYWIAVQANTITPSQGGTGLAEQVYGPIGGQCVNSSFTQVTRTTAGACYGGKTGNVADGFTGTAATLASAEHISKVIGGTTNVTAQNFGFSFNVVTNINDAGQGSLRQFISNANSIVGPNALRFVPAVASNQNTSGYTWWKISLPTASVALPIITDAATTISGFQYSNADGVTQGMGMPLSAKNSVGYGSFAGSTSRVTSPKLEVNAPTSSSFPQTIGTTASGTVIQGISITGGYKAMLWAGAGSSNLNMQGSVLGLSPASVIYNINATSLLIGDINLATTTSGLSGTIQGNIIVSYGGPAIQFYGLSGLSSGQYVVSQNMIVSNTNAPVSQGNVLNIQQSPNINIVSNYMLNAPAMMLQLVSSDGALIQGNTITNNVSGPAVNLLSSNNVTLIGNVIQKAGGYGVSIQSTSNSNLIQQNLITNNGSSGIVLVGNNNGNQITQNEYGTNGMNAIDLGADGVTLNSNNSACVNADGKTSGNNGLARPVLTSANLVNFNTLEVEGTMCANGTFTIEVYQAIGAGMASGVANNDMGADNQLAGEGTVYLGSVTSNNGVFSGTFSVSGLNAGNSISATAIRLANDSNGVTGDTSEFSANLIVDYPNFGSAPDSYLTSSGVGGAIHYVVSGLSLGTVVSTAVNGSPVTPPAAAAGGDGISELPFPPLTLDTTSYSVVVNATNTTGIPATLIGWIDYNLNGTFDPEEGVSVTVPNNSNNAAFTLTWPNVQALNLTLGVTYARFRISTDPALTTSTPAGLMLSGEVEDYGGSGVLEILGRSISGTVYNDVNRNGILESGETGSGLPLYAKAVPRVGTNCTGPATQAAAVDAMTGNYTLIGNAPGNYCIVIDTNNTLSDITPNLPTSWTFTGGGNGINVVKLMTAGDVSNVNFGINNATLANGLVFYDIGTGGGVKYNGTQDGTEVGVGGVTITITGNLGSETATSNADGSFTPVIPLAVSDGSGSVTFTLSAPSKAVSVSKGVTGLIDNTAVTQYSTVTVSASSLVAGGQVRFGLAPVTTLQADGLQSGSPGSAVYFAHTFTAGSAGTLILDFSDQQAFPPNSGWSSTLLTDPNCSGIFSNSSTVINGPIAIGDGRTKLCLFNRVEIPPTVGAGSQWVETLQAQFIYGSTVAGSNHSVTDTTTVGSNAKLQLVKAVDKSSVRPGASEVLTYTIQYSNQDIAIMNPVVIDDSVPAYTSYVPGSAMCLPPIPSEVSCIVDTSQLPALKWILNGNLKPAERGTVTYQVTVN